MGAQTEKRKQMFMDRYAEVEKSEGEGIYNFLFPQFYASFHITVFVNEQT